jgi:hypothetical protein
VNPIDPRSPKPTAPTLRKLVRITQNYQCTERTLACACGCTDLVSHPESYQCRSCGRVVLSLRELP